MLEPISIKKGSNIYRDSKIIQNLYDLDFLMDHQKEVQK